MPRLRDEETSDFIEFEQTPNYINDYFASVGEKLFEEKVLGGA